MHSTLIITTTKSQKKCRITELQVKSDMRIVNSAKKLKKIELLLLKKYLHLKKPINPQIAIAINDITIWVCKNSFELTFTAIMARTGIKIYVISPRVEPNFLVCSRFLSKLRIRFRISDLQSAPELVEFNKYFLDHFPAHYLGLEPGILSIIQQELRI